MTSYNVKLIPIFKDNYVFVIESLKDKACIVVDPGSAKEVIAYLKKNSLTLEAVFLTHHHSDHIDGLNELLQFSGGLKTNPSVFAPVKNRKEIPEASEYVSEGCILNVLGLEWKIIDLPGHTLGHIGFYNDSNKWLFSGDVLFGLGCGRLFEGTPSQQFESLNKIKVLGSETKVFCTHEYTELNLAFCKQKLLPLGLPTQLDKQELQKYEDELLQKRSHNEPSVPLILKKELQNNPFLLSGNLAEFTEIRTLRNSF